MQTAARGAVCVFCRLRLKFLEKVLRALLRIAQLHRRGKEATKRFLHVGVGDMINISSKSRIKTNSYKELEREIYTVNFILVHSTLSYIQFLEQPLGFTSNHLQVTTTQPQRGDLENHKTHSPSLQLHTSS